MTRYADVLCPEPVQMIQRTLAILQERIANFDRPGDTMAAVQISEAGAIIAGPSGAAISNCIFVPPGCRIPLLIGTSLAARKAS